MTRGATACAAKGCDRPPRSRGYCNRCYERLRRNGLIEVIHTPAPEAERIYRFFSVGAPDDCWEWAGFRNEPGYGMFKGDGQRTTMAHRAVYEILVGPIPDGLVLDHLCVNPPCVNPGHLEPVTPQENRRRQRQYHPTHCPQGHPYAEANTYIWRGGRYCRACNAAKERRAYRRRKQAAMH